MVFGGGGGVVSVFWFLGFFLNLSIQLSTKSPVLYLSSILIHLQTSVNSVEVLN